MLKNFLTSAAASLLAVIPQPGAAQTVVLPGTLRLPGYRASCGSVDTMIQLIDDIASAYKGRIILHPRVLDLPRAQQLFWYTHECAHQIFGPGEAAADCWAVQQGNIQSWLTRDELSMLSGTMRPYRADETRSNGATRVVAIDTCFVDNRVILPKGDGD
jgi:hypothetical protein